MADVTTARLELLFPTPIMKHRWDDSDALNADLRQLVLERERTHGGISKSNVGGWQSTDDLVSWGGEAGRILAERTMSMVNHATKELFSLTQASGSFGWKFSMWANVNRRGQFNRMHFHPGSTWSGTYYVDAGDPPPPESPLAGCFGFHDPNQVAAMSFFVGQLPHGGEITPETGMMVLFPSYLPHIVYPYQGGRPRISIAFNVHKDPYP